MSSGQFEHEDINAKARKQERGHAESAVEGLPDLLSALGNAGTQRVLRSAAVHRAAGGGGTVDEAVAQRIQSQRGGGQQLDAGARRSLEPALGQDFSDVRVHADGESDSLNRAVQAEAFTTGNDIFFRSGAYNPGSSDGQKLLAHELTHVVQQDGAPAPSEMTVSDPDDASEREAGAVAEAFSAPSQQAASVSRAALEDEDEEQLQGSFIEREAMEDEEELQGSWLEREAVEDEDEELSA